MKTITAIFIASVFVSCTLQQEANAIDAVPKRITDFPMEILLCIYTDLDLNTLTAVAKTHPYNQRAAEIVFTDRYSKKAFDINDKEVINNVSNPSEFDALLNVLQTFGHKITKLKLRYFNLLDQKQSERINIHLSEFVTDSLTEIDLSGNDVFLKGFTGPFNKVEVVHLRDGYIRSTISKINFNLTFPAVRILDLTQMKMIESSVEHHFPYLVELKAEMMDDSSKLERRLRLNPQLRSLSLASGKWTDLRLVSEVAPNLERLNVLQAFDGQSWFAGDFINFKNLKVFTILMVKPFASNFGPIPITFGNLEQFECFESTDKWFEVMVQNKKLRRIVAGEFTDEHLQRIAEELPDLEDFTTAYRASGEEGVNNVVRFMETSKRLRKANFFRNNDVVRDAILAKLQGWSIVKDGPFFAFARNEIENEFF